MSKLIGLLSVCACVIAMMLVWVWVYATAYVVGQELLPEVPDEIVEAGPDDMLIPVRSLTFRPGRFSAHGSIIADHVTTGTIEVRGGVLTLRVNEYYINRYSHDPFPNIRIDVEHPATWYWEPENKP